MSDSFESPIGNQDVQAAVASALEDPIPDRPSVPMPHSSEVVLPGGYLDESGVLRRHVSLRELNGLHEERLSKVSQENMGRWVQTLLECGVESIDGVDATDLSKALRTLPIGDREFLVMATRRVTYGDLVEMGTVVCSSCKEAYDVAISLTEDLPVREMSQPHRFTVDISKGRKAHVHVPTGADQIVVFDNPNATDAERKSVMLSQCIEAIEDTDGSIQGVAGVASVVKGLSIPDRNKILDAVSEAQPGPRYNELTYEHDCGYQQPLFVGLMHLFPGL